MECDTAFAVRDPITLLFHLGVVDPVVAIATVRWTHGTRSGAEFVCMSAGCQERLREWVVSRANGRIANTDRATSQGCVP